MDICCKPGFARSRAIASYANANGRRMYRANVRASFARPSRCGAEPPAEDAPATVGQRLSLAEGGAEVQCTEVLEDRLAHFRQRREPIGDSETPDRNPLHQALNGVKVAREHRAVRDVEHEAGGEQLQKSLVGPQRFDCRRG